MDKRASAYNLKGITRLQVLVKGIVQGVGFRPFIYNLARNYGLKGFVVNSLDGVVIEIEGQESDILRFLGEMQSRPPRQARISLVETRRKEPAGYWSFEILASKKEGTHNLSIPPDLAVCNECRNEILDPQDRHYLYPFTNCTNCGPRFSIIFQAPYDRSNTSMGTFVMCNECKGEYHNPSDRRFHAQPVACPLCGPVAWLLDSTGKVIQNLGEEVAERETFWSTVRRLLLDGAIVAIKGIGGFHLACDAHNAAAVEKLRRRKARPFKPFAVMARDLSVVRKYCHVSQQEEELLLSPAAPIVILRRLSAPGIPSPYNQVLRMQERDGDAGAVTAGVAAPFSQLLGVPELEESNRKTAADGSASNGPVGSDFCRVSKARPATLAGMEESKYGFLSLPEALAPHLDTLGVMLPYTPLHLLLFDDRLDLLVMTSGNVRDLPLVKDNDEALECLRGMADYFLVHDREILNRCDDSLVQVIEGETQLMRRSRGYVSQPLAVPLLQGQALGAGGEMKNAFCLIGNGSAFFSQHLGEMGSVESIANYREALNNLEKLTGLNPRVIAYDAHPGYNISRLARELPGEVYIPVQHHHAHLASCMAENGLNERVIGIILDGTGYGSDGAIWGFEVLEGDYYSFERHYHLAYLPLPGGDQAVREPWRVAAAYLYYFLRDRGRQVARMLFADKEAKLSLLFKMVDQRLNSPPAGSCGRLFDAVAALLGVCDVNTYEGQAATELSQLVVNGRDDFYPFTITGHEIDPSGLLEGLVDDLLRGDYRGILATRFHNTVVKMLVEAAERVRVATRLNRVVLSGGSFQNGYLLTGLRKLLEAEGFQVYYHRQVPTNDGGLALGQAMIGLGRYGFEV